MCQVVIPSLHNAKMANSNRTPECGMFGWKKIVTMYRMNHVLLQNLTIGITLSMCEPKMLSSAFFPCLTFLHLLLSTSKIHISASGLL